MEFYFSTATFGSHVVSLRFTIKLINADGLVRTFIPKDKNQRSFRREFILSVDEDDKKPKLIMSDFLVAVILNNLNEFER